MILSKIEIENRTASARLQISRASFLTNLFHGNSILSSFQLAGGYSPSILGLPSRVVPVELLKAQIELATNRALQKLFLLKPLFLYLIIPSRTEL